MYRVRVISSLLLLFMLVGCKGDPLFEASVDYKIVDGVVILDEPERVAGQQTKR